LLAGLDRVRFRRPVVPGDQMRLEVTLLRSRPPVWKIRGVASVDGEIAASAEITAVERRLEP
jgi:3-hydroxymyristoyl/3-hydroxydecanoyl-(acyl carrier protein) dehydratase